MNTIRPARAAARPAGFTLIEVMIVVLIVGILAAGAFPSYSTQLMRSHRATAQGLLSELATRQHQHFVDTRRYADSLVALHASVPQAIAARYEFRIERLAGPPTGFRLAAVPLGRQQDDLCGSMTIDSAGARTPEGCW